jgi:hypothetical protein
MKVKKFAVKKVKRSNIIVALVRSFRSLLNNRIVDHEKDLGIKAASR